MEKSVKCAIGEHLVLAELLKRGFEAYIAHGPTQSGWDIAVVKNEQVKRVQVKAIGWPNKNQQTVTVSRALNFDYLVVVLLDLGQPHSRYLVCNRQELEQYLSSENDDRKGNSRSWYISKNLDKYTNLENSWATIGSP
ncbi:hypothetical protein GXP65_23085 [Vibrio campbellii]|uniref:hypothetical protein n=1 Tax=Vibrio sp. LB10LO1 TaxID=2711207 RepID=UPI001389DF8D|nr:hypothetical protein [Vibrio sp. LB10LO1]NDJ83926.1 hypothetical protein [Vibrio sp. LB10LO1]